MHQCGRWYEHYAILYLVSYCYSLSILLSEEKGMVDSIRPFPSPGVLNLRGYETH